MNSCGLLVDASEWKDALTSLVTDPQRRFDLVYKAQSKLLQHYSIEQLKQQIEEILHLAKEGLSKRR